MLILQVFFMMLIMLTGNYNFFNITYIVACMSMLVSSESSQLSRFHYFKCRLQNDVYRHYKCVWPLAWKPCRENGEMEFYRRRVRHIHVRICHLVPYSSSIRRQKHSTLASHYTNLYVEVMLSNKPFFFFYHSPRMSSIEP
jgi:hypothetical protein